jgi:hypothetical protein
MKIKEGEPYCPKIKLTEKNLINPLNRFHYSRRVCKTSLKYLITILQDINHKVLFGRGAKINELR